MISSSDSNYNNNYRIVRVNAQQQLVAVDQKGKYHLLLQAESSSLNSNGYKQGFGMQKASKFMPSSKNSTHLCKPKEALQFDGITYFVFEIDAQNSKPALNVSHNHNDQYIFQMFAHAIKTILQPLLWRQIKEVRQFLNIKNVIIVNNRLFLLMMARSKKYVVLSRSERKHSLNIYNQFQSILHNQLMIISLFGIVLWQVFYKRSYQFQTQKLGCLKDNDNVESKQLQVTTILQLMIQKQITYEYLQIEIQKYFQNIDRSMDKKKFKNIFNQNYQRSKSSQTNYNNESNASKRLFSLKKEKSERKQRYQTPQRQGKNLFRGRKIQICSFQKRTKSEPYQQLISDNISVEATHNKFKLPMSISKFSQSKTQQTKNIFQFSSNHKFHKYQITTPKSNQNNSGCFINDQIDEKIRKQEQMAKTKFKQSILHMREESRREVANNQKLDDSSFKLKLDDKVLKLRSEKRKQVDRKTLHKFEGIKMSNSVIQQITNQLKQDQEFKEHMWQWFKHKQNKEKNNQNQPLTQSIKGISLDHTAKKQDKANQVKQISNIEKTNVKAESSNTFSIFQSIVPIYIGSDFDNYSQQQIGSVVQEKHQAKTTQKSQNVLTQNQEVKKTIKNQISKTTTTTTKKDTKIQIIAQDEIQQVNFKNKMIVQPLKILQQPQQMQQQHYSTILVQQAVEEKLSFINILGNICMKTIRNKEKIIRIEWRRCLYIIFHRFVYERLLFVQALTLGSRQVVRAGVKLKEGEWDIWNQSSIRLQLLEKLKQQNVTLQLQLNKFANQINNSIKLSRKFNYYIRFRSQILKNKDKSQFIKMSKDAIQILWEQFDTILQQKLNNIYAMDYIIDCLFGLYILGQFDEVVNGQERPQIQQFKKYSYNFEQINNKLSRIYNLYFPSEEFD